MHGLPASGRARWKVSASHISRSIVAKVVWSGQRSSNIAIGTTAALNAHCLLLDRASNVCQAIAGSCSQPLRYSLKQTTKYYT